MNSSIWILKLWISCKMGVSDELSSDEEVVIQIDYRME